MAHRDDWDDLNRRILESAGEAEKAAVAVQSQVNEIAHYLSQARKVFNDLCVRLGMTDPPCGGAN